jgi:hypothetical protein
MVTFSRPKTPYRLSKQRRSHPVLMNILVTSLSPSLLKFRSLDGTYSHNTPTEFLFSI